MSKRDWTAEDLARQAVAAQELIEYLAQAHEDDDDLMQDSIEGETDFLEVIDRALEQIAEAEMLASALKRRIDALTARKKRFDNRKEFLRGCLEMAMAQANGDRDLGEKPFTLQTAAATVTLKLGRPGYEIIDEMLLPAEFWKTPAPTVDKAKISEHVAEYRAQGDNEDDVIDDEQAQREPLKLAAGLELTQPPYALTIRRI